MSTDCFAESEADKVSEGSHPGMLNRKSSNLTAKTGFHSLMFEDLYVRTSTRSEVSEAGGWNSRGTGQNVRKQRVGGQVIQKNGTKWDISVHSWRARTRSFVLGTGLDRTVAIVVVMNLVFILVETDMRAKLRRGDGDQEPSRELMTLWNMSNSVFMSIYVAEIFLRLAVVGLAYFHKPANYFDLGLVALDLVAVIFQSNMDGSTFRPVKLLKLLRMTRSVTAFTELNCLVSGITQCFHTLFWASILIFGTLCICSIIAVEYFNPLMENIDYGSCEWCPKAFRSVMESNLTFFQIVTGDGWGTVARPLIQQQPWTALVFVAVIVLVVWGLLNLIVAATLDAASRARASDVQRCADERSFQRQHGWEIFRGLCGELDTDNSGGIGLTELREGLMQKPLLRNYFSLMGIEDDDIALLFNVLDTDEHGDLTFKEFHNHLYKMKTLEVKTHLYYVMQYVTRLHQQIGDQKILLEQQSEALRELRDVTSQLARNTLGKTLDKTISRSSSRGLDTSSTEEPSSTRREHGHHESFSGECHTASMYKTKPNILQGRQDGCLPRRHEPESIDHSTSWQQRSFNLEAECPCLSERDDIIQQLERLSLTPRIAGPEAMNPDSLAQDAMKELGAGAASVWEFSHQPARNPLAAAASQQMLVSI